MKAIILAGGFAKRLKTISKYTPKPLLTINGKPNLDYLIDKLESIDEIDKIIILSNSLYKDQFYYISSKNMMFKKKQIIVIEEPNSINKNKDYGPIGGLYYFFKEYDINDDFMIIGGDNFFDFNLESIVSMFKKVKCPVVAIYKTNNADKEELSRLANATIKNERIIRYDIKPENPKTKCIGTMIYCLPNFTKNYINDMMNKGIKEPTGKIIEYLIKNKIPVYAKTFTEKDGIWIDIGVEKDYKKVFKYGNNKKENNKKENSRKLRKD